MPAECPRRWTTTLYRTAISFITTTLSFHQTRFLAVIQQGMNDTNKYARRYHWLGETVTDFVNEPHSAILSEARGTALNLVASESDSARATITDIANETQPEKLITDLKKITTLSLPAQSSHRCQRHSPGQLEQDSAQRV